MLPISSTSAVSPLFTASTIMPAILYAGTILLQVVLGQVPVVSLQTAFPVLGALVAML